MHTDICTLTCETFSLFVDIYAMNGEPTSALAMCTVPYGPENQVQT